MSTIAMFAGSFDPPTLGHKNIIERAAALYDRLYVVVADNKAKKSLFTPNERVQILQEICTNYPSVSVVSYDGLMVDFAKTHDVRVMIRGVRAVADFNYEFELAMTNKQLYPKAETLFMPTDPRYFLIRSSAIKEMASYHADISSMVPETVMNWMRKKYSFTKSN